MTDPLSAVEVDCRDLDCMMLNVERLLSSELYALSTGEEFKAAVSLWCRAWKQVPAGSLPNVERLLASFSGTGKRWPKVRDMALRGFLLCQDGRLYHKTISEDANRAYERKIERRNRTAAATEARRKQRDDERNGQRNVEQSATVTKSQGRDETRRDASLPPPSPPDTSGKTDKPAENPAATAAAPENNHQNSDETRDKPLSKRAKGMESIAVKLAVTSGNVLKLVEAFRGNLGDGRDAEWLRDTDGMTIGSVALIMAWRRSVNAPVREPSGFRQAKNTWADLDRLTRLHFAATLLPEYGLELPAELNRQPTPAGAP
jgi:uncharacterized protein YdaU (DUF1376 family)